MPSSPSPPSPPPPPPSEGELHGHGGEVEQQRGQVVAVTGVERIYVGGLDPVRLKPSEVIQRLQSLSGIKILSIGDDDDFVVARPNRSRGTDRIDSDSESNSSTSTSPTPTPTGGSSNSGTTTTSITSKEKLDSRPFVHINAILLDTHDNAAKINGDVDDTISQKEQATSTTTTTSSPSALSIIAKQFNNIKWKGCKLSVEAAKPHFLERLEEERRQRQQIQQQQQRQPSSDVITSSSTDVPPTSTRSLPLSAGAIPRRLRVRKRYGDEAVHVDTKPWDVTDWSNFKKARIKLQKRIDKHKSATQGSSSTGTNNKTKDKQQKQRQNQHQQPTMLHRAVHIRFSSPSTSDGGLQNGQFHLGDEDEYDDDDSKMIYGSDSESKGDNEESSSSHSVSSSSSSVSSESHRELDSSLAKHFPSSDVKTTTTGKFVWSDDDEESDDDDDDDGKDNDNDEMVEVNNNENNVEDETGEGVIDEDGLQDEDQQDRQQVITSVKDDMVNKEGCGSPTPADHSSQEREAAYQWSSDDDNDDDGEERDDDSNYQYGKNTDKDALSCTTKFIDFTESSPSAAAAAADSQNDEFLAGFDEESDDEDIVDSHIRGTSNATDTQVDPPSSSTADLADDVTHNLNVLASIFPDLSEHRPASLSSSSGNNEEGQQTDRSTDEKHRHNATERFNDGFGLMPRFDPTSLSSQKYVLKEESKEDNDGVRSIGGGDDDKDEAQEMKEKIHSNSDHSAEDDNDEKVSSEDNMDDDENEPQSTSAVSHIYQEGKLEGVFREARHAWETQIVGNDKSTSANSGGGGFSFGFDLGDVANDQTSFGGKSFNAPSERRSDKNSNAIDESTTNPSTEYSDKRIDAITSDLLVTESLQRPRRRGLLVPEDELISHVERFFALNNGEAVMKDPVGFYKNNKDDQEEWKKERLALTLDWKRKRKLACSRHQNKKRK